MRGILIAGLLGLIAAMPGEASAGQVGANGIPRIEPPVTGEILGSALPAGPIVPTSLVTSTVPLTATLRLKVATVTSIPVRPMFDLQQRFDSAMVDYFPADGDGFHVSAGLRLFARHNFLREAARAVDILLFAPRGPGGAFGGRRFVPVAMAGFSHRFGSDIMVGAEAGAMTGRLYTANGPTPAVDQRLANGGSALNPVARLAFNLRF